jgi:hypothetical protein
MKGFRAMTTRNIVASILGIFLFTTPLLVVGALALLTEGF